MTSTSTTEAEVAMASAALKKRYTPEEYLALERQAEFKSEYLDGSIFAMAGARREHNLIAWNLSGEIRAQLKNRPCEGYTSDMRVLVSQTGLYTYPDVTVVCGQAAFLDENQDTLLNPTVIVEVLSPTTEKYDRGKKFGHYRRLASLREYVLVAQDEVLVERYVRQGDDWLLTDLRSMDDTLRLTSIDCQVALREVYARIEFPQAPPAEAELLPR
jgi:Uma2 family endonuclease